MRNSILAQLGRRSMGGRLTAAALAAVVLGSAFVSPPAALADGTNTITTVAGGKVVTCTIAPGSDPDYPDYVCDTASGDGGAATKALLITPTSVAVMPDGGYVVSSWNWSNVRRVSPTGTITTLAGGNGLNGFSGDGGPATKAQLNLPMGVAVQADGSVLIADSNNFRIRKVSPTGVITTVAGNGQEGFAGDGVRRPAPNSIFPSQWPPPATAGS